MQAGAILWTLLALQGSASRPATRPAERSSAFLARLARALRRPGAPAKLESFEAEVKLRDRSRAADADVDATIWYREPYYLRTRVQEGSKVVMRGRKKLDLWMHDGKRGWSLHEKEYERDRKAIARDFAIARLLARSLFADRELAKLSGLTGPRACEFARGRDEAIDAFELVGVSTKKGAFPLALSPEHAGPVRVEAWFAREGLHPVAIRLTPLDAGGRRPVGPAEEMRFARHTFVDGLLLPLEASVFHPNEEGKMRLRQTIELRRFLVNPERLVPARFARPK